MSIVIVHGPHGSGHSITADLLLHLKQQACQAGRTLEMRACGALRDFIAVVGSVTPVATEFVLLDPGSLTSEMRAHPESGLSQAIDDLRAPYIDVHDEFGDGLECCAGLQKPPAATVIINGNIGSSYRIGLLLALRRLESASRSGSRRAHDDPHSPQNQSTDPFALTPRPVRPAPGTPTSRH